MWPLGKLCLCGYTVENTAGVEGIQLYEGCDPNGKDVKQKAMGIMGIEGAI